MKKSFKGKYGVAKILGTDTLKVNGKEEKFLVYIYIVNVDGKRVNGKIWYNPKRKIIIVSGKNLEPLNLEIKVSSFDPNKFFTNMLNNKSSVKQIRKSLVSAFTKRKSEGFAKESFNWIQKIPAIVSALLTIYFIAKYWLTNIKNTSVESSANSAEEKLNSILFKDHSKDDSRFKVYSEIIKSIESVANNERRGVIIGGPPGTGKTYITRRTLYLNGLKYGKHYEIVKGTALDISAVYEYLYRNRNRIVVFDDFDKPLESQDTVNLLKSATDSYPVRILSLVRSTTVSTGEGSTEYAPSKFEYKGRIIILTNLPEDKIDTALRSRLGYIHLYFNPQEMLKVLKVMIHNIYPDVDLKLKEEVLKFLEDYSVKHKKELSIRVFKQAIEIRILYPNDWKQILAKIL